jgi:hypothetical protein
MLLMNASPQAPGYVGQQNALIHTMFPYGVIGTVILPTLL